MERAVVRLIAALALIFVSFPIFSSAACISEECQTRRSLFKRGGTSPAAAPANVADGTIALCGRFYTVQKGETCGIVATNAGISLAQFLYLNPEARVTCPKLNVGAAYCVQTVGGAGPNGDGQSNGES